MDGTNPSPPPSPRLPPSQGLRRTGRRAGCLLPHFVGRGNRQIARGTMEMRPMRPPMPCQRIRPPYYQGMKRAFLLLTALALTSCAPFVQPPPERLSFVVSMEHPADRLCHVEFHCDGLKGGAHDFIMPAWMPGDYRMMNYATNVTNFT